MLYIYCAGGFGKEVFDIASRSGYNPNDILFIDDAASVVSTSNVVSFDCFVKSHSFDDEIIIAHGEPLVRAHLYEKLLPFSPNFATIIDPSSIISTTAKIGKGAVVCPFCSISSCAILSDNCVVNTMSIIGHDCVVGSHSVISSMVNLGGSTIVKNQVYVGMGALVRESLILEDHCIVSMGSVVHRHVESRHIVQGDPAKSRMINQSGTIFKR
jgi:sugar O-acyltransferase (sialic acid O-acetyltransferase NeuD family)